MGKSVQLRCIAEAEARSIWEIAQGQRATSEPLIGLPRATTQPDLLGWVRRMALRVVGAVPKARWVPCGALRATPYSSTAVRNSPADLDHDRLLASVLITDIVDSTKLVAKLGDRQWLAVLDRHDEATRHQIKRFGGREVRNCGDGFLATFDSSTRAVRCATAIAASVAPLGIAVRSGIHAGEIHLKRGEIRGIAVHVAARIAAIAPAGESLVSNTVRDLATGSGLVFEDRGMHLLRGLSEEIHLYAVRAGSSAANPNRNGCRRNPDLRMSETVPIQQPA
jgi:class 3 adenylate cyclase